MKHEFFCSFSLLTIAINTKGLAFTDCRCHSFGALMCKVVEAQVGHNSTVSCVEHAHL